MCGIIAFIGSRQAFAILKKGLSRLEYRGYDSAGICVYEEETGKLLLIKKAGKVKNLEMSQPLQGTLGIAHTRWATHGGPTDANSHPHLTEDCSIAVVHNGIITNYDTLKKQLLEAGYKFSSDTDTEVIVHLVQRERCQMPEASVEECVVQALQYVQGTFGVVFCFAGPDGGNMLVGARRGSPLIVGVGEDNAEFIVASDASAIVEHTKEVIYLEDDDVVVLRRGKNPSIFHLHSPNQTPGFRPTFQIQVELEEIEKGGFEDFMLKEIHDQPSSLRNCMRGRLYPLPSVEGMALGGPQYGIRLGGIQDQHSLKDEVKRRLEIQSPLGALARAKRILIVACGTSWHAGLIGEYLIEKFARIPVEVEYASEFRYRDPVISEHDVVVGISQSGETADTLEALRIARSKGVLALGIVNVVGSTIARFTDAGIYLHAGPEIGVASTKAFSAQVIVLTMLALVLGKYRNTLAESEFQSICSALHEVPDKVGRVLQQSEEIRLQSRYYRLAENCLFLGRGVNFPVALEGALKLKEISYIHAEGYPAAEMKHGPIALIDRFMPVVVVAPSTDPQYEKVKSNIEEVRARQGTVIVITDVGNTDFDHLAEVVIRIEISHTALDPLLTVVPLQLLSYHIAKARGCNVDQPRNLAKSVTVE
jgi:glucosamine--fructose-6-phosphate aminotransferase (isomerizing)